MGGMSGRILFFGGFGLNQDGLAMMHLPFVVEGFVTFPFLKVENSIKSLHLYLVNLPQDYRASFKCSLAVLQHR